MSNYFIPVDETYYLEKPSRDLNFESFFNKTFTELVKRTERKYLPFYVYNNCKVYMKCQIMYFLYLNQHQRFSKRQILSPIIEFIMKNKQNLKLRREDLRLAGKKMLENLSGSFIIFSQKNNKTNNNEYYFNIHFDRLFSYGLFWNKAFISMLLEPKNKYYFKFPTILKFVRMLDFINNKEVTTREMLDSGLFGRRDVLTKNFLTPLVKLGLVRRKRRGNNFYYSANFHEFL